MGGAKMRPLLRAFSENSRVKHLQCCYGIGDNLHAIQGKPHGVLRGDIDINPNPREAYSRWWGEAPFSMAARHTFHVGAPSLFEEHRA